MKYKAIGNKPQRYYFPTQGVFTLHAVFTSARSCTGNGDVYDSDVATVCVEVTGRDAARYEIPEMFVHLTDRCCHCHTKHVQHSEEKQGL